MKIFFIFLHLLGSFDPHKEYSPRELEEIKQTTERWRTLATQPMPAENIGDYLDKLGAGLRGSSKSKEKPNSDRGKLHYLLKERLLSIPGHAEHFRDRINSSRLAMEQARASDDGSGILGLALVNMAREQRWGFATLQDLPSAETVRVLGEFLSDDRGANIPKAERRETGEYPNSLAAVTALSKLGIAKPPTPEMRHSGDVTDGLESWKQWYSEIESGRRTFRFIGDDTEYDLRGPVRRGGGIDSERNVKRTHTHRTDDGAVPKEYLTPNRILPYLIGGLFLLAGLGVYLRGKRGNHCE